MVRKLVLLLLALGAVLVAIVSYDRYYARKDVSRMVREARLTAATKTALALNRHLKNTEIEVAVSDGTVTLSGAVGTDIQKQLAENIALSIRDVVKVQNSIVVSRAVALQQEARERSLGERLDDLTTEAAVKTALLLNENVSARDIGVKAERGLVTLTGAVKTPAEAELARKIAEDVEGVVSVRFAIEVEGPPGTDKERSVLEKVDDARVVAQARAAFMVNRNIDSSEIEVSSLDGAMTLTGIVRSGAEKDLAQKIAEDCWGVKSVANELRIK
jgi:osmotically-inducible protein OsmY